MTVVTNARIPYPHEFHKSKAAQVLLAEFVGTACLAVIIVSSIGAKSSFEAFAIGLGLIPLVYAFGHISKAHFNPAATIAFFCVGTIDMFQLMYYIGIEFLGAFVGALCGWAFLPGNDLFAMQVRRENLRQSVELEFCRVFFAELVFTFILVTIILQVAVSRAANNDYYGLAIGTTVLSAALSVGGVSGAALNPAISFCLQLVRCMVDGDCTPLSDFWVYWLAHLFASVGAAFVFLAIHGAACQGGGCECDEEELAAQKAAEAEPACGGCSGEPVCVAE